MRAAAVVGILALFVLPAWAGRAVVEWKSGFVNVRSGPGAGTQLVGRLTNGAEAEVLEDRGEWVRVRHPGGEGWVFGKSLRRLPESAEAAPLPVKDPEQTALREAPAPTPATPAESGAGEAVAPKETLAPEKRPESSPTGYLSQYTDDRTLPAPTPGGSILRMVSGLLLVLALVAAAVYAVRRFFGSRFLPARGAGIRVLATRSVGARHGLLLVEAGGLVWLLAQGPDGLRLISEIREPGALGRLNERYGFLQTPFESELRRQLGEEPGSGGEGPRAGEREPTDLSAEERLAALRRRPTTGGER